MSDERLDRIEDMLSQLIGMVGTVINEQHAMKDDMKTMRGDIDVIKDDIVGLKGNMERLERQQAAYFDTQKYMLDKLGTHDHDIYILKQRLVQA